MFGDQKLRDEFSRLQRYAACMPQIGAITEVPDYETFRDNSLVPVMRQVLTAMPRAWCCFYIPQQMYEDLEKIAGIGPCQLLIPWGTKSPAVLYCWNKRHESGGGRPVTLRGAPEAVAAPKVCTAEPTTAIATVAPEVTTLPKNAKGGAVSAPCKFGNCDQPRLAANFGFCKDHRIKGCEDVCKVVDCRKPTLAGNYGYCKDHRVKGGRKVCKVGKCGRPVQKGNFGFCEVHRVKGEAKAAPGAIDQVGALKRGPPTHWDSGVRALANRRDAEKRRHRTATAQRESRDGELKSQAPQVLRTPKRTQNSGRQAAKVSATCCRCGKRRVINTTALCRMRGKFQFALEDAPTPPKFRLNEKRPCQAMRSNESPVFTCGELLGCDCSAVEDDEAKNVPRDILI